MNNPIVDLAKSNYWQTIYAKLGAIGIMNELDNKKEFSKIQISFLQWLDILRNMYESHANGDELLSEHVFKDFDRIEAYLVYKTETKNKKEKQKKEKVNNTGLPAFRFVSKPNK